MIIYILIIVLSPAIILLLLSLLALIILLFQGGDPIKVSANQVRRYIDIQTDSFLDDIQTYIKKEKENE